MLFYISAEKSPNLRTNLFFVMAYLSWIRIRICIWIRIRFLFYKSGSGSASLSVCAGVFFVANLRYKLNKTIANPDSAFSKLIRDLPQLLNVFFSEHFCRANYENYLVKLIQKEGWCQHSLQRKKLFQCLV